jgi:hypothetical protein
MLHTVSADKLLAFTHATGLTKAKTMLIRDEKRIKKINKSQLSEQAQLWRAISSVNVVQNIESFNIN